MNLQSKNLLKTFYLFLQWFLMNLLSTYTNVIWTMYTTCDWLQGHILFMWFWCIIYFNKIIFLSINFQLMQLITKSLKDLLYYLCMVFILSFSSIFIVKHIFQFCLIFSLLIWESNKCPTKNYKCVSNKNPYNEI